MFGDNSKRTKQISSNAISIIIAALLFVVGLPWFIGGTFAYNQVVARSSSPIGTTLTFQRSQAEITISDIYTDKNKDVLIARLNVPKDAQANLPFKGSDYKVYISSKSTDGMTEMPILFGRMSTDGDMFLVIPKPTDTIYSIFIQNKNYIASSESDSVNSSSVADLSEESISATLSSYQYDDSEESNSKGTYTVQTDLADIISFRLTLKPAINEEAYRAKVINKELLTTDKDGNSEFDFESFFNAVFKESALKQLKSEFETAQKKKSDYETRLRNYEERLAVNENDATAKEEARKLQEEIDLLSSSMEELSSKIATYEALEYDESLFASLQTKAKIINSN